MKEAYDYSDTLIKTLTNEKKVIDVSKKFIQQEDGAAKIRFSLELLKEKNLLPSAGDIFHPKNDAASLEARNRGNQFFIKDKDYVAALECYNKSICLATSESENLAIGYANRSAIYLNAGFYKLCLENIELAMKNNYPEKLKPKLEQRRKECLELLNNNEDSLEKFAKEIPEKVQLSYPANEKMPILIEGLEYVTSEEFGRHIRAKQDLYPGDIIIVEKCFSKCLQNGSEYKRCANCLEPNYLNLIPCGKCTRAMFCSEKCQKEANSRFHRFECPILDGIFTLFNKITVIAIRTALFSLTMFDDPRELEALISEINVETESAFDLNYSNLTEQQHFRAIYALATNESARSVADLFQRSNLCAITWFLFRNHTNLSEILTTKCLEDLFLNMLFRFGQAAAVNYHTLAAMAKSDDVLAGSFSPKQIGSGSFALCSLLNHSCAPNVVRVGDGDKNIVIVNRVIKRGTQIFDNYGAHHCLEDLAERQKILKDQYIFTCSCEACQNNYPLFSEFPIPTKFFLEMGNDEERIVRYDKEFAKKKFQDYKKLLIEYNDKYPCFEVCASQEHFLACVRVLIGDVPLELQLKPLKN
ncbi:SET and MYND domain-containing protein 4-like [Culicoides brevitarsis]|uniref:SET and MYND domain-containing protein 4-like n=1 Tax=Culicoides brevitarsis TaxID=469753 RepID=UPI00307BBE6C